MSSDSNKIEDFFLDELISTESCRVKKKMLYQGRFSLHIFLTRSLKAQTIFLICIRRAKEESIHSTLELISILKITANLSNTKRRLLSLIIKAQMPLLEKRLKRKGFRPLPL